MMLNYFFNDVFLYANHLNLVSCSIENLIFPDATFEVVTSKNKPFFFFNLH